MNKFEITTNVNTETNDIHKVSVRLNSDIVIVFAANVNMTWGEDGKNMGVDPVITFPKDADIIYNGQKMNSSAIYVLRLLTNDSTDSIYNKMKEKVEAELIKHYK